MSTQKEDFERKSAYLAETKELLETYVTDAGGNASGTFRETVEEAGKLMHELDLQPLTFTGAVEATYDGKTPVTVNIPQGGSGTGGGGNASIFRTTVTSEEEVNGISVQLPAPISSFHEIYFRLSLSSGITENMALYIHAGEYKNLGSLNSGTRSFTLSCRYLSEGMFSLGTNSSSNANPSIPTIGTAGNFLYNIKGIKSLRFYSNTSGVNFPAGSSLNVWGVYKV